MPSSSSTNNGQSNGNYGSVATQDDTDNGNDDPLLLTKRSFRHQMSSSLLSEQHVHSMRGILFIMLGSFSFACMFLLVKLLESKANSFTLVFYRSWVQIALSLMAILYNGEHPLGFANSRGWLMVRGGFGAGAVLAFFYGIQNLPLPDAVTLQFTTPVFAALFAVVFAGEPCKILDIIGAVVCLSGVALIAHPTWLFGNTLEDENDDTTTNMNATTSMNDNTTTSTDDNDNKGLAVAVTTAGAAMAGLAYVSVRLIENTSANVMVLYYATLSIPLCMVGSHFLLQTWAVWGSSDDDGTPFTILEYGLLLLTGLAGYGGQFFTNLGLQRETAATGTLATSTQIVWTYIFEILILHEGVNAWSLGGTSLILGFMIIVGISKLWERQPPIDKSIRSLSARGDEATPLLLQSPSSAEQSA